jgi:hypothetical protein
MKKLSPVEQKASSKVLDELRKHAQSMMSDKVKGLKKVTIASDSPEGLKKGLSKAEEILGAKKSASDLTKSPMDEEFGESEDATKDLAKGAEDEIEGLDEESPEHEEMESPEYEASEEECKTPEEVDAKIKELMALKQQMLAKK